MKPFTVIRGGLHPDEKPAKIVKKAKYSEYQLQLMAQMKQRFKAQMDRHAERYWAKEREKEKLKREGGL